MRISSIDGKLICSNYVIYLSWVYVRRTAYCLCVQRALADVHAAMLKWE